MSEIKIVRCIAARPAIVFDALTTVEGMTSWWGPDEGPVLFAASDARVGGRFRVRFRKLDGSEHECSGEFLEIEKERRIVMSWQWTWGGHPGERERVSRLELQLRPIETGTELTLIHAALRDEESASSHGWGWGGALNKLVRRFAVQS
ncbi:MAG TPA: SRPBCC domain-containing protein [Steroidobacteraceae bacterium]|nr:SRPBCC domain-containing protein [Steroidobacteraceae bacterium]